MKSTLHSSSPFGLSSVDRSLSVYLCLCQQQNPITARQQDSLFLFLIKDLKDGKSGMYVRKHICFFLLISFYFLKSTATSSEPSDAIKTQRLYFYTISNSPIIIFFLILPPTTDSLVSFQSKHCICFKRLLKSIKVSLFIEKIITSFNIL